MLESLEKLRGGHFGDRGISSSFHDAYVLANDIQAEVDKFYLPRPLFEDGEPVQWGDIVEDWEVVGIEFNRDGGWVLLGSESREVLFVESNERISCPPEPDSQEKIDEECHRLAYVVSQAGNSRDRLEDGIRDLLARQRKLDGVE